MLCVEVRNLSQAYRFLYPFLFVIPPYVNLLRRPFADSLLRAESCGNDVPDLLCTVGSQILRLVFNNMFVLVDEVEK